MDRRRPAPRPPTARSGRAFKVVLRRCDTYLMKRTGAIALVVVLGLAVCVVAASSWIGGGTVRSSVGTAAAATTDGQEAAAEVATRPGRDDGSSNGGTNAAG